MRPRIPNRSLTHSELAVRLEAERLRDERPAPRTDPILCGYGSCGESRYRLVNHRWVARVHLVIGTREWYVCESCADLLLRERKKGEQVERRQLP